MSFARLYNIFFIAFFVTGLIEFFGQWHVEEEIYLFPFFKGNGEDGLLLAYSHDGYDWFEIGKDYSF